MEPLKEGEVQEFLREFTELSLKYRLGVAGPFDLFVMEDDDLDRTYRDDGRGKYELY